MKTTYVDLDFVHNRSFQLCGFRPKILSSNPSNHKINQSDFRLGLIGD